MIALSRARLYPWSLALCALAIACDSLGAPPPPPSTASALPSTASPLPGSEAAAAPVSREAASYSVGLSFATQWKDGGLDGMLSEADLIRGIRAGLAGTALSADDRQRASAFMRDAYSAWAAKNKTAAAQFLAQNAHQPGVKTTATGLQYQVMTPGDSGTPAAGPADHVMVQYRGRLLNGTEFDSTYSRGKPGVIRPTDAIAGWREALGMMSKGAVWRVFVPPDLAYALTPPPSIPPNSLLIFDIEVLGIDSAVASRSTVSPAP
jgi:FKBP-type peptidyl-prolyl cis-trans isomerase